MMVVISAARAHTRYLVLQSFLALPTPSTPLLTVLNRLPSLFALSNIINPRSIDALSFVESNSWGEAYLTSSQLDTLRLLFNELLDQLLPDTVALTDAWEFSDASLCRALGMQDGNVYKTIMSWVKQLPINNGGVEGTWGAWVDTVLKAQRQDRARL